MKESKMAVSEQPETGSSVPQQPKKEKEKMCRICLLKDNDDYYDADEDPMIVPCRCTGNRQYVHTSCLEHWRIYQAPAEFLQCGHCSFLYHLPSREHIRNATAGAEAMSGAKAASQATKTPSKSKTSQSPWWRKARLCCAIVFDFVLVTLVVQGLVIGAGYLIWFLDSEKAVAQALGESVDCVSNYRLRRDLQQEGNSSSSSPQYDEGTTATSSSEEESNDYYCNHVGSIYYFLGFLLITLVAGVIFLCCGCCLSHPRASNDSSASNPRGAAAAATDEENPLPTRKAHNTSSFYQRRQQRRQQRQQHSNSISSSISDGCCLGPWMRKVMNVFHHLKHDVRVGTQMASSRGVQCGNCGSCCHGGHSHSHFSCDSEALVAVMIVALLVIILMTALSGFLVIMIVLVIVFQRIVQRHVHFMHRRRLVQEFPVLDLAPSTGTNHHNYDDCGNNKTLAENLENQRPKLTDADLHSLRKLGLFLGTEEDGGDDDHD